MQPLQLTGIAVGHWGRYRFKMVEQGFLTGRLVFELTALQVAEGALKVVEYFGGSSLEGLGRVDKKTGQTGWGEVHEILGEAERWRVSLDPMHFASPPRVDKHGVGHVAGCKWIHFGVCACSTPKASVLACRPHLRGVQGAEKAIGEVCDGRAAKPQKAAVGITGGGGEDSGGSGRGIDRGGVHAKATQCNHKQCSHNHGSCQTWGLANCNHNSCQTWKLAARV